MKLCKLKLKNENVKKPKKKKGGKILPFRKNTTNELHKYFGFYLF